MKKGQSNRAALSLFSYRCSVHDISDLAKDPDAGLALIIFFVRGKDLVSPL